MVALLTGSNSFEIAREIQRRESAFGAKAEKIEGKAVEMGSLGQLLAGATLFSDKRLIVITELSENSAVWAALPEWLGQVSIDTDILLVEPVPDKRTKTYKALQTAAEVKDFPLLAERDSMQAERWLEGEAKAMGIKLDAPSARLLIRRSLVPTERGQPVVDQWRAFHSLEKLAVLDDITPAVIETYIDAEPIESVFSVFETALKGDRAKLHQLLADLEPREDPFKVFGLLSGQAFQLAALAVSDQSLSDTAKAIGVHPYAMSKLAPMAKKLTKQEVRPVVQAFTAADEAMKTSRGTPWTLIEQALMKVAAVATK